MAQHSLSRTAVGLCVPQRLRARAMGMRSVVAVTERPTPLTWFSLLSVVSVACLVVVTVSGIALLFWYDPSTEPVEYSGSYPLLRGVPVSSAYASTLRISFDVPGGLLIRQIHHWAALVLPAVLVLQMLSTFFTGGFRRPRHWLWVLLGFYFFLVLGAGWSGYALPDDQLAGTGLRIVEGVLLGIPVVGTRASFLLFGGEFPGTGVVHLYWLHVAVFPALLLVVLLVRLRMTAVLRPAQLPAPGRTERNVVGLPFAAVAVRAVGLALVTAGLLVVMGGLLEIDPVWLYGPASAGDASAGSQPDWYTDFLDGALRLAPRGWELHLWGHSLSLALLLPQAAVGLFLGLVVLWPFVEARVSGDLREHHLLDRPREHPVRTALGVSGLVFFASIWLAGSTDHITVHFGIAFEHQVLALRTLVFLGPLVAFPVTRELCRGLESREREERRRGYETGRIFREPDGGYHELRAPLSTDCAAVTSSMAEDE